ncbi:MAG: lipoprotein-releasing ABC transporter permease subunit [Holosporales bacterium]|jgi:lipoprotein-releasing system permease protein
MLISKAERAIAGRYLRLGRQERFVGVVAAFAVLGIGLGVATLIVVLSVMDGFKKKLFDQVIGVNGHISLYAPEGQGAAASLDTFKQSFTKKQNIQSITEMWEQQALITVNGRYQGVLVKGMNIRSLPEKPIVGASLTPPLSFMDNADTPLLVLGARLAERLGLQVGDSVTLTTLNRTASAFGSLPRQRTFRLASLFTSGLYDYDTNVAFINLPEAGLLFHAEGQWNTAEVFLKNPDAIDETVEWLVDNLPPGVGVRDWRYANRSLFAAIEVERSVMFIILSLIILVAAFNIISTMVILVKNKSRDIAVLRTLGATPNSIRRIFMAVGLCLGGSGLAVGVTLGVLFARNIETVRRWVQHLTGTRLFPDEIYFLNELPSAVAPGTVALIAVIALLLVALATWYPANKASQVRPLDILRYG